MTMRVVLTGGGTGGHAYPALSIAEALRAEYPDCKLLYLGGKGSIEERLASEAGIPFVGLTTRKLTRWLSPSGVLTLASLVRGLVEAIFTLRKFKPDVVVGTGGYAAAAVVRAQALRRGKTVILEPDAIPGRTNQWLSRFATRICIVFKDAARCFPAEKTVLTGLPIRSSFRTLPSKSDARTALGLAPDLFTLMIVGGSQGARRLNQIVVEAIPELRRLPVQIYNQAGPRNFEEAEEARRAAGWENYHVQAYIDDIRPVYAASDLIMCRCGSSTLAEVVLVGLSAILVPYPYSHADHQSYNARAVAEQGAGIYIPESELTAELLVKTIDRFLRRPEELFAMAEASRRLGKPDAAVQVARVVAELSE